MGLTPTQNQHLCIIIVLTTQLHQLCFHRDGHCRTLVIVDVKIDIVPTPSFLKYFPSSHFVMSTSISFSHLVHPAARSGAAVIAMVVAPRVSVSAAGYVVIFV